VYWTLLTMTALKTLIPVNVGILIAVCLIAVYAVSCAGSKESTPPSFDMSEYRKVMERQKNQEAAQDNSETSVPEMTAEEHERAGDRDAQHRNFPLAGVHYSKALKADPTRNSARLKLGQIYLRQGMLEPALTQFKDLQHKEPDSAPSHQGIGNIYLLQGKLREAEAALSKAVQLDQSNWVAHNLLGLVYDQGQRHADAIMAYKAALTLQPREPSVLNNLGLAYALSGDYEAAIQAYEQALAAGSTSVKLLNNLGVAYAQRQRYTDALESFKKATDEPRAYNNLGVTLLGTGNAAAAAACFEKAIELNPQYYEKATENLREAQKALARSRHDNTTSGANEAASCP
jgi:tetratricopeptide (TPR) repeat protein